MGSYALITIVNPSVGQRTTELAGSSADAIDEGGKASNSLVTRLLVWHTAYQAFQLMQLLAWLVRFSPGFRSILHNTQTTL